MYGIGCIGKKRKTKLLIAVMLMTLWMSSDASQAEEGDKGLGKLEGIEFELKLYEKDIDYLQEEIRQLLSECSLA